jgi:hypothetical protein
MHGLYRVWAAMIQRCHNPANKGYRCYGARGITVCDRWRGSFAAFAADMGERPRGTSIDRMDNSRGYEPGNCRWATAEQQNRNRRDTKITEAAKAEVQRRIRAGERNKELAVAFNVHQSAISRLRHACP